MTARSLPRKLYQPFHDLMTGRLIARLRGGDPFPALGILLCAALALRLAAMIATPLAPEEAYYWMYAQHPSLSYFDHPPMVAWVIGAGTWVFGNNEFGVRVVGNLLMVATSGLLYLFGRWWFGRSAGLLSAAAIHILPVYYGIGFIATMDSALLFFWTLGLVGVTLALQRGRSWGWYLAGIALGGAMLSKYTGVFLASGTVLAVLAHRPWRRHLLSIHPYLAVLLAAALFSPVLIWNARHDWASFRFQFVSRWGDDGMSLNSMLTFVGFQLAVATPVLLAGLVVLLVRAIRRRRLLEPRWLMVFCFSLPLILVMAHKSLRSDIHINWTAPAYVSLLPAMAWLFLAHRRARGQDRKGVKWVPAILWTAAVCTLINLGLAVFLLTVQPRLRLLSAFGPWPELAAIVEGHEDQVEAAIRREPLVVAGGKYRLASVLAFYRSKLEQHASAANFTTSQWIINGREGLGYPYWARSDWNREAIIYVDDDGSIHKIDDRFQQVEVVYDSGRKYAKRYQIAICRGLR